MFHKIRNIAATEDFVLIVQFSEGITKKYDLNPLFEKIPAFNTLQQSAELYYSVKADVGGYGIIWNEDLDLSCDELWDNGEAVKTEFDGMLTFEEAAFLWELNESTLRKAVSYGKLKNGIDVQKFGKQWVVLKSAMIREYGNKAAIAYTDGSYNPENGMWGYGACLYADSEEYELSGKGEDIYNGRQIQGEITAALVVCEKALLLGVQKLEIRYDYEGVRHWAMGTWKTNKPYTKDYAAKMQEYRSRMEISFTHVKAHSGVDGNEKVDKLAKAACGILSC